MGVPAVADLTHCLLCVLALLLCCYAYYVESSKVEDENFQAVCDFSPQASCSVVLTSQYGRGMGIVGPLLGESHPLNISNAIYGLMLYSLLVLLGFVPSLSWLVVLLQGLCVLHNIYLAYILFYVLRDVCVLCLTMYTVNAMILTVALCRWWGYGSRDKMKSV